MEDLTRRTAITTALSLGAFGLCGPRTAEGREDPARQAGGSSEFPGTLDFKAIEKAMPGADMAGTVCVLAWKIVVSDRNLRIETCLALKALDAPGRDGKWVLTKLFRHPLEEVRSGWRVSFMTFSKVD
jgi:hypothetical protein